MCMIKLFVIFQPGKNLSKCYPCENRKISMYAAVFDAIGGENTEMQVGVAI